MTQSPWFFYGAAKPDSQGRYQQYGLYNPVVGRFALVHHDKEVLRWVAKLFSSRYNLFLCDISASRHFSANLIDNSVCHNWTIKDVRNIGFTRFPNHDADPFVSSELVDLGPIPEDELLVKDFEYLCFASTWISLLFFEIPRLVSEPYLKYLAEDIPRWSTYNYPLHPVVRLRDQICSIIYREFVFDTAQEEISKIIENYDNGKIKQLDLRIDRV